MAITIDESAHPIIRVTMSGTSTDTEYETYHARMTELLTRADAKRTRIGVLIDGRTTTPPTAKQRKRMADQLEATHALQRRACFGWSIVLANALQRGVLTAILWIRPIPSPHLVAATPAEGEAWLRSQRAHFERKDIFG